MPSFFRFHSINVDWYILAALLFIAWFWPLAGDRFFGAIENFSARISHRKWLAILAIALAPILIRVSILTLFPIRPPGVADEFSYLLAGDTFAHGRLANPPHPMWFFLDTLYVLHHPTNASIYPPGQGAVLAFGQLLGHPWIGVLLSMAAMFGVLLWMLQGWLPPKWALLGAGLPLMKFGIFGYWLNSYWGGAVAAIGGALVMGALPRILRKHRTLDAFIMGLGIAILVNSRPYEGLVLCLPIAAYMAWWLFSRRSPGWRILLPRVVAPIACVLLLTAVFSGYYNWRVTGSPTLLPHTLDDNLHESVSSFVWRPALPPLHYANHQFEVVFNHQTRNYYTHTWDDFKRISANKLKVFVNFFLGPSLIIPFICLPLLLMDRRMRLLTVQFGLYCLGTLAVVWFHPHYAAPALATLCVLMAQLFRHLRLWKFRGRRVGIGITRVLVLFLVAAIPFAAFRAFEESRSYHGVEWGFTNWDRQIVADQLGQLPGQSLVIVRYSQTLHDVQNEWVHNGADIDNAKIVWAREIPGVDMRPLLDYFKDRKIWLAEPDENPVVLKPYPPAAQVTGIPAPQ